MPVGFAAVSRRRQRPQRQLSAVDLPSAVPFEQENREIEYFNKDVIKEVHYNKSIGNMICSKL